MDKRVTFNTQSDLGQHFAESIDITPRGGGLEKIAGELHPELEHYIKHLRPDPAYQYVLMTPMGAFEFWGMNVNGDVFPEMALSFDHTRCDPLQVARALEEKWVRPHGKRIPPGNYKEFGYKTFLDAKRYRHHANKNPEISYGDIVISVWNPAMHRVELISRHDREKAKRVGADEIIQDLDEGKPRQISMGCKVPFDICTICGHISRTTRDYCEHLRMQMGSVTSDGKVVGAVNLFPRFFDLSDVFVPAAKESGVLRKVAQSRFYVPGVQKAASTKHAEITKRELPNAGYRAVREANNAEPDLPPRLMKGGDFGKILSTLAMLGIVAKPHEFQRGALHRMGHGDMAETLASKRHVFSARDPDGHAHIDPKRFDPSLARRMGGMIGERSGFYPHLPKRVIRITVIRAAPVEKHAYVQNDAVLDKVASAYAAYRQSFRTLPPALDVVVSDNLGLYQKHFFGDLLIDSMTKTASIHSASLSESLVSLYLYNAHTGGVSSPPSVWGVSSSLNSLSRSLLGPSL